MTFPSGGRGADGRWRAANTTERDAIGSNEGLEVNDFCVVLADGGEYICLTVAGTDSSTWAAESTGAAGPFSLAATLAIGTNTGGNNVNMTSGDAITSGAGDDIPIVPGAGGQVELAGPTETGGNVYPALSGVGDLGSAALKYGSAFLATLLLTGAVEFTQKSANPGSVPTNTLYQDDGTNYTAGTLVWDNAAEITGFVGIGGNTTWSLPNAELTVGDGTGAPRAIFNKADAQSADFLQLKNAGVNQWIWRHTSGEALNLRRYSGGVYQEDAISFALGGAVSIPQPLYLAGAVSGNGVAGAADLVVGAGAAAHGITIFSGNADTMRLNMTDSTGTLGGGVSYTVSAGTLYLNTSVGNARFGVNVSAIHGTVTNARDNGTDAIRWKDYYGAGNAYLSGGLAADAAAGATNMVVGALADAATGITLVTSPTGIARFGAVDVTGGASIRGGMQYNNSDDTFHLISTALDIAIVDSVSLRPGSSGTPTLGRTTGRWSAGYIQQLLLAGALTTDGTAGSNSIILGDGSAADVGMTFYAGGSQVIRLNFQDSAGGSDAQLRVGGGIGFPTWTFRSANADRWYFTSTSMGPVAALTGAYALGLTTNRFSDIWGTTLYLAGALSTNGVAGASGLVIGSGTLGLDEGLTIFSGTNAKGSIEFIDTTGVSNAGMQYDHSTQIQTLRTEGSGTFQIHSTYIRPSTTAVMSVGSTGRRFTDYFGSGAAYLAGALNTDGVANFADLVVGDGTGGAGATLHVAAANTGSGLAWTSDGGTTKHGSIEYDRANGRFFIRANGAGRYVMDSTRLYPGADGVQGLGHTTLNGWNSLVLTERADHVGTPTATRGEVWLKSGTHQTLMVTDDEGRDHPLSLMPLIELLPERATFPGTGAASYALDPTSAIPTIVYAESGIHETAFWSGIVPREYLGGDLTLRIHWTSDHAAANNVRWSIAFEAQASGFDINASGFDTATLATTAGSTTVGVIVVSDITLAVADLDGVVAGDPFRISIQRLDSDGADTSTQNARLVRGQLLQDA